MKHIGLTLIAVALIAQPIIEDRIKLHNAQVCRDHAYEILEWGGVTGSEEYEILKMCGVTELMVKK